MKAIIERLESIIAEVIRIGCVEGKLTGFCIGNTRKLNSSGLYFSPIRNTNRLVAGSVVVYDVNQAMEIARKVDGKVEYIFIDAEKKVSPDLYGIDNVGNIERSVREVVKASRILTYKGNDLTVDSIEGMVVQMISDSLRGISGRKAAIIGAGNVGSKLALKLVERGLDVTLIRRDRKKLEAIVLALNIIKPKETIAQVRTAVDNLSAAQDVDLLIGLTPGVPVITRPMVDALATGAILIDGGKGCIELEAIMRAQEIGIPIYRTDIRPGFEGHVGLVLAVEKIIEDGLARANFDGVPVVSSGLLAYANEVVIDCISRPKAVFGIADGQGDFCRILDESQAQRLKIVNEYVKNKGST